MVGVFVLRYVPFGRFVYGIGGGLEAARLSGVRTARVLIFVYAISGFCASIAGIITTSRLFVGHPTAGSFIMLDSIAAVVIGGTSLMGGRGSDISTFFGVLIISVLAAGLAQIGANEPTKRIITGAVIVVAVVLDTYRSKRRTV